MTERVISLKMTDVDLDTLHAIASFDDATIGHEFRRAIDEYIEKRRLDPDFLKQIVAARDRIASSKTESDAERSLSFIARVVPNSNES